MTREEQWLMFIQGLQSLTALNRPLRICVDSYFTDESDFGSLPVLFPYVERIGFIVDPSAAAWHRQMFRDHGWDKEKVVPVVDGDQFNGYYDVIVSRWWN